MKFSSIATTGLAALSSCPDPTAIEDGWRFHSDLVCSRGAYNSYKASLNRHLKIKALAAAGGVSAVPNQKTAYCPLNPQQFNSDSMTTDSASATGLDTVWIVENTASSPVVISFTNSQGIEVSALHPDISPPEADPTAILQPHQWLSVNTFEGHVLSAREILPDGQAGNILLQHRVGLIPVGQGFESFDCPLQDLPPIVEETGELDPQFTRTPTQIMRPCNTMDVGFRNMAGCPVNGYYVTTKKGDEIMSCTEEFKFHLGVEEQVPDFMHDWSSKTKFEGTFVGHTFSFRLAHNPAVVVDSITLQPTRVTDCPDLKEKVAIRVSGAAVAVPVGLPQTHHMGAEQQFIVTELGDVVGEDVPLVAGLPQTTNQTWASPNANNNTTTTNHNIPPPATVAAASRTQTYLLS